MVFVGRCDDEATGEAACLFTNYSLFVKEISKIVGIGAGNMAAGPGRASARPVQFVLECP
jgi:hypothetical protein